MFIIILLKSTANPASYFIISLTAGVVAVKMLISVAFCGNIDVFKVAPTGINALNWQS